MDLIAVRVRCEGCRRVKVVSVDQDATTGRDGEVDLVEAEPGEFIERHCTRCGTVTDHEVLAEAQVPA